MGWDGSLGSRCVATLLAAAKSVGSVRELRAWKAGVCGALMGSVAPTIVVFLMTGGVSFSAAALAAGVTGVLGGLFGAGLVTAAKRAETMELNSSEPAAALGTGSND